MQEWTYFTRLMPFTGLKFTGNYTLTRGWGVAAGAWLIKALGLKWTEPPIHSPHTIGSEPRLCRPNGIKDCSGDYTATSPTPSYTLYLTNRITVDKTLCAWGWKEEVCVHLRACVLQSDVSWGQKKKKKEETLILQRNEGIQPSSGINRPFPLAVGYSL